MKPKVIVYSLLKGGVGKTAMCFNVTCTEAILNPQKKFLMIDFDMQANLTNFFSIEAYEKVGFDSSDMLLGFKRPEDVVIKSPLKDIPNLDLIPASFALFQNEITLKNSHANEYKLQRIFEKNSEFFDEYDYIVMDTNPSLSLYNINVLFVTDAIVNVIKNSCISSLKALEMQKGIWNSLKNDLDKQKNEQNIVVINMYDSRTKNAKLFLESIESNSELNKITMNSKVRSSIEVANAILDNKPVILYNNKHKVSQDIIDLVKELEDNNIF